MSVTNQKISVNKFRNFSMYVKGKFKDIYIEDHFEVLLTDLITSYVKDNDTFLDIGSHYGYYSLMCGTKSKSIVVHAFEPVKVNFDVLQKNITDNKLDNIHIHNLAVSDRNGMARISIGESTDASSLHGHPIIKTTNVQKTKMISIDNFDVIKTFQVVKIDTEGHELSVLAGMRKKILKNKPQIFLEFNPKCLLNAGTDPSELIAFIHGLDYSIFLIKNSTYELIRLEGPYKKWKWLIEDGMHYDLMCLDATAEKNLPTLLAGIINKKRNPEAINIILRELKSTIKDKDEWIIHLQKDIDFLNTEINKLKTQKQSILSKIKKVVT